MGCGCFFLAIFLSGKALGASKFDTPLSCFDFPTTRGTSDFIFRSFSKFLFELSLQSNNFIFYRRIMFRRILFLLRS